MGIKLKMYELLVNRDKRIKQKYEGYKAENIERHGRNKLRSWIYLFKLNFLSLCGALSAEDKPAKPFVGSESGQLAASAGEIADKLCKADVVSFDIFDTLIFRPFDDPRSVFYLVGERLAHPDFRNIRINAEGLARKNSADGEASLSDIYQLIEQLTAIPCEMGMKAELEAEMSLCCADPFMLDVWELVRKAGKRIIVTSDMYLPSDFLSELIEKNGFVGAEQIFVSCEEGCGKYNGRLFEKVKARFGGMTIAHIGDNYISDVTASKKSGITAVYYPNINASGNKFRTKDMSYIIGSAYRGIVNKRLYCGKSTYSPQYEYGYKCGGIIAVGFCSFIHRTAAEKNTDKILFFSRDGYILKKIYDMLYPGENTEYFYWSRAAAAKLGAEIFPEDLFRRFVFQKSGGDYRVSEILSAMDIADMEFGVSSSELLTANNANKLVSEMQARFSEITAHYSGMNEAAQQRFRNSLEGHKNVLTVDCGWAGSGNIIFEAIANRKFGIDCNITGLLAGTNTYSQADSDFSEIYLQTGKLIPYCFSSSLNRDVYKHHVPSENHNIYFEMLFGAPEPSFRGYALKNGKCCPMLDDECENARAISEIHSGELDFANDYINAFRDHPYMMNISGRDAYAPFMQVITDKKAVRAALSECVFDADTSGAKRRIN